MYRQEFKKQMASNAFGNAVHTSQAKQSGLLVVVVWVLVGGFSLFLTRHKTISR